MYQFQGMPDYLTDNEMMLLYNPYYFSEKVEQMKAKKEDLYYKSCSWTVYDQQEGIHRESISVENIVEKTIALETHIKKLERSYKAQRERLIKELEGWQKTDIDRLEQYFYTQYYKGTAVTCERIEQLKKRLFYVEHIEREKRGNERWRANNKDIIEKAQAIAMTLRGGEKDDERSENRKRASNTVRTLGSVADDS